MKFTIKHILSIITVITMVLVGSGGLNVEYAHASDMPEYIKIGLLYGGAAGNQTQVTFENGVKLGVGENDGVTELAEFPDINMVSINNESGVIRVIGTRASGETIIMNEGFANANCVMPYGYSKGETVTLGNNKYRGCIMFNLASGNLNIINFIPVEEYLYGVINGEMSKSYPAEALKAQAVAARSYAACKLGTHNSYGFDLCNTTHCQVYRGYNDEYPETTAAVEETEGDTVNYEGKPVAAFFFKNSGGYTQASEDVWNGKLGYLRAVKDEYSPAYPWSQTYSFSDLSSKLSSAGYNVGILNNVSITKRNQSGAVDTLQFTGTGGTAVLQKDKIRSVLGSTAIKSTMFTFGEAGSLGKTENDGNLSHKNFVAYGMTKSMNNPQKLEERLYVVDKTGISTNAKAKNLYIHDGKSTKSIEDMITNSENANNQVLTGVESVSGESVTFTGLGYGHGIGLPQDSAIEMAKKDFTYKEILKYYYTDVTID